jgi:hypothetical protein
MTYSLNSLETEQYLLHFSDDCRTYKYVDGSIEWQSTEENGSAHYKKLWLLIMWGGHVFQYDSTININKHFIFGTGEGWIFHRLFNNNISTFDWNCCETFSLLKAGHSQRKPVPWNRFHKTGNYGFIEKCRCFKLEVTLGVTRNNSCATIVSRDSVYDLQFKQRCFWMKPYFQFHETDFMELVSSVCNWKNKVLKIIIEAKRYLVAEDNNWS